MKQNICNSVYPSRVGWGRRWCSPSRPSPLVRGGLVSPTTTTLCPYLCTPLTHLVLCPASFLPVPPRNLRIEYQKESVLEGEEVELNCTAMASRPATTIRWFKGTKPLPGRLVLLNRSAGGEVGGEEGLFWWRWISALLTWTSTTLRWKPHGYLLPSPLDQSQFPLLRGLIVVWLAVFSQCQGWPCFTFSLNLCSGPETPFTRRIPAILECEGFPAPEPIVLTCCVDGFKDLFAGNIPCA